MDSDNALAAKEWWNNIWKDGGVLGKAISGLGDSVAAPIQQFFTEVWSNFGETESGKAAIKWWSEFWGEGGTFQSAISNVDKYVVAPIASFFSSIWDNFKESDVVKAAKEFWDGLFGENGTFSHVPAQFTEMISGIGTTFTELWKTIQGDENTSIVIWWNGLWGPEGSFATTTKSIKENVIDPIGGFFSDLLGVVKGEGAEENKLVAWWSGLWGSDGSLAKITKDISKNIVEPIGGFFNDLLSIVKGEGDEENSIVAWWTSIWGPDGSMASVANAIETNVTKPIAGFFTSLWGTIKGDENNNIVTWWSTLWNDEGLVSVVSSIQETIITPIATMFSGLWASIKGDEENSIGAWWSSLWNDTFLPIVNVIKENITDPIGDAFSSAAELVEKAWNGVGAFFVGVVNGIIDCINAVINALNSINITIPAWGFDLPGIMGGGHIGMPEIKIGISGIALIPKLPMPEGYANGGFPTTGQMFFARENGIPELVGRIGSRTAVANNDQIVQGVANGVASGQAEQNGLLRQQNDLLRQLLSKSGRVEAVPSAGWGRFIQRSTEMYASNTGV